MHLDQTLESARGLSNGAGSEPPARQRLEQLYRLSSHGIPVTVWATGRPESELRQSVDSFAESCRALGACVAAVHRRPGVGYARFVQGRRQTREMRRRGWTTIDKIAQREAVRLVADLQAAFRA
jgi:hypothetical protein